MPLKGFLAAINPSQDNATERSNLRYFLKIIDMHANRCTEPSAPKLQKWQSGVYASSRVQLILWNLCHEQCNRVFQERTYFVQFV